MGDMNTLSPRDKEWHQREKLVDFLLNPKVNGLAHAVEGGVPLTPCPRMPATHAVLASPGASTADREVHGGR